MYKKSDLHINVQAASRHQAGGVGYAMDQLQLSRRSNRLHQSSFSTIVAGGFQVAMVSFALAA